VPFLALFLLTAVTVLVPAALLALTTGASPRRRASPWQLAAAVVVVSLLALPVAAWWGGEAVPSALAAVGLGVSVALWAPAVRDWDPRALVVWGLAVASGVAFLGHVLSWTLTADLSTTAGGNAAPGMSSSTVNSASQATRAMRQSRRGRSGSCTAVAGPVVVDRDVERSVRPRN
jgi:hypothetical protein